MTTRGALLTGAAGALVAATVVAISLRAAATLSAPAPPPAGTDAAGDPLPPFAVARIGSLRRPIGTCGLAFSEDGKVLRCGCGDAFVRDFDVATGAMLRERRVGGGFVEEARAPNSLSQFLDRLGGESPTMYANIPWAMAISPDGTAIATAGPGGACVTRGAGRETMQRAGGTRNQTYVTECSADGSRAAVAWEDGAVSVFGTGSLPALIPASGRGMALGVAWSPDAKTLAVQAGAKVEIVDAGSGAVVASRAAGKQFSPRGISYSPDGARVALAVDRSGLALCDARTLAPVWETSDAARTNMGSVAFAPDGRSIAWGMNCLHLVDAADGSIRRTIDTEGVEPWRIAWSPDGKHVAALCGGLARVWDAETGAEVASAAPPRSQVSRVEFSPDGRRLLTNGRGRTVDVWDAATGALVRSLDAGSFVTEPAWSPDGSQVRCVAWPGDGKNALLTFDPTTGARTDSIAGANYAKYVVHGERPLQLRYTPTSKSSGAWDVADPRTGEVIRALTGGAINSNAFSRDGRYIASTSGTAPLEIADLTTGVNAPVGPRWSNKELARLVAFSPDASLVALSMSKGTLLVIDRASGATLLEADSGLHGAVTSIAVSSDRRLLAAGDAFGDVRLWSIRNEASYPALAGHRGPIWSLEFSADGSRLASGSADATANVWDVSRFEAIR